VWDGIQYQVSYLVLCGKARIVGTSETPHQIRILAFMRSKCIFLAEERQQQSRTLDYSSDNCHIMTPAIDWFCVSAIYLSLLSFSHAARVQF